MSSSFSFNSQSAGRHFSAKKQSGFALLITVTLLAFLVLLLVSLAALTRVETQVAANNQALAKARQNALMAMNIAIGRLIETASYDQRVTGTGDLVPAAQSKNPFWTAVWDTTGAVLTATPNWLVSGATVDPATDLTASSAAVQLIGAATAGTTVTRHVYVQTQSIIADNIPGMAGPQSIGKFAYWVGDEGVKAPITLEDYTRTGASQTIPIAPGGPVMDARQQERVGRMAAPRGGPDSLNGFGLGPEDDAASASRWLNISKLIAREQTAYSLANTIAGQNLLRDSFHAITTSSYGVLSNPLDGGLKRNLTYSSAPEHAYIHDMDIPRIALLATPTVTAVAGTAGVNDPSASPKPIITEIALDVIPFRQDSPGGIAAAPLRIGYRLRMEYWNPYPVPIAHVAAVGADDYRVRVSGLPTLTFSCPLQPVQPSPSTFNLADLITPTTDLVSELAANLTPGEFIRRSSNPVFLGDAPTAVTPVIIYDSTPAGGAANLANDRLSYSWPQGTLRFEVYRNDGSTTPIMIIKDVAYKAGSRNGTVNWFVPSNNAFQGTAFTSTTHFNKGIVFHAAIDESWISNLAEWVNPPASALVTPGVYPTDLRATTVSWGDGYFDGAGTDPADNADQPAAIFSNTGFFQFGVKTVISDVSMQPQLSLGQTAFAGYSAARPFAMGNPWGGSLNELFDRGYLLPVGTSWTDGQLLTNARYRVTKSGLTATDMRVDETAKQLLVAGMFNVNSTSATAWEVFLGRSTKVTAGGIIANTTVRNPAFYFTNTADIVTAANVPSASNQGFTGLTQEQLTDLATRIAAGVRARAQPFVSVSAFLNSGIVATAITDNMASASATAKVNQGGAATPYSSSYLTQAVLLNALQPFLAVRSDTFLVRSYGENINPITGAVDGRSYAEAIVQRMPERLVGGNAMDNTAAGSFGRRFSVVSFRWLSPADI